MAGQRETWASGRGFVLATIGAAVGLGNIWRFSYVAGENGGGAFLVVYLISVALVGAPIVIAELALGRRSEGDAVAAYERTSATSRWRLAGWLAVGGSFLILSYYSVIAGWALKYFLGALTGELWDAAAGGYGGYFTRFIGNPGEAVGWQMAMLAATMFVVAGGVQRGIEAVNRILMPLLALFVVALAGYAATLPGAVAGWRFLFLPDWSVLLRGEVLVAALGQAFFSIGLGMAVFITYGSYMKQSTQLPRSAAAIVVGDTLFAIVAGLAIFPAVFAFGMDPQAGPQLAFITLPQIFLAMPGGTIVGIVFFGLLVSAAMTSMIALLEVPVATVVHRTRLRRWSAVTAVGTGVFLVGLPSALSYGLLAEVQIAGRSILDFVDQSVSNYLLPLAGILVCVYVGWCWRRDEALAASGIAGAALRAVWLWLLRIVAPAMILVVLLDSVGVI
ncbi:MAG: sodium-dependent transporter [Kiloniellaceae bacterium]